MRMSDSENSSSDEEICLQRKALDVELPDDFDPTIEPQNGIEYLQLVMYETKHCKKLVTATIDETKIKKSSLQIDVLEGCMKAPQTMLPTKEWQEEKLKDFTNFRKFLEKKIIEYPTGHNSDVLLKKILNKELPNFELINNCTQEAKLQVLQGIVHEISLLGSGKSINYEVCVWIYAILGTLGIPLSPHACHCIRQLARRCSKIRSQLPAESYENDYVSLNLFICLVSRYFRQLDLSD